MTKESGTSSSVTFKKEEIISAKVMQLLFRYEVVPLERPTQQAQRYRVASKRPC